MKRTLVLLVICVLTAGCLLKRTTHTLYLETDGTVTWTVLEADVRSSEDKASARREEEKDFLDRVASGEHAPADPIVDETARAKSARRLGFARVRIDAPDLKARRIGIARFGVQPRNIGDRFATAHRER